MRCYQDNTASWRKKQPRTNDDSVQTETQQAKNSKTQRFNGNITLTRNGYLLINHKECPTLFQDKRNFMQKYNACINHNKNVDTLEVPEGITIINSAMRTNNNLNVENNDDKNEQNNSRKRISFELEDERSVQSDLSDTNHRDKRI